MKGIKDINMSELKMLKGAMISTLYELEYITGVLAKQHNENGTSKLGNITAFSRKFYRQYGVEIEEFDKWIEAANWDD